MRDITMPEVRLPDVKLPDGLREMNLDDIIQAAQGRLPKKSDLPNVDLSKVELPKQIANRLPGRRRTNPLLPIAGILAVGAAIAAVFWLVTSPTTGPRVRHVFTDLRNRLTGQRTDVIRYDDEDDLGSLLTDPVSGRSSMTAEAYTGSATVPDLGNGMPVGPGEMPEGVGRPG